MAAIANFALQAAAPTLLQTVGLLSTRGLSPSPTLNLISELPSIQATQVVSPSVFPPDNDLQLAGLQLPDPNTATLPPSDLGPWDPNWQPSNLGDNPPEPAPLPDPEPSIVTTWPSDSTLDPSIPEPSMTILNLNPDPTSDFAPFDWEQFWLPPHSGPMPTYLSPAPLFFPDLLPAPLSEEEQADLLPTTLPEPLLADPTPEVVVDTGSVLDGTHDWAFYEDGVVTVDGVELNPAEGAYARWLPGDVYTGTFSNGLMIGKHLIPYPEEYRQWMEAHNIQLGGGGAWLAH